MSGIASLSLAKTYLFVRNIPPCASLRGTKQSPDRKVGDSHVGDCFAIARKDVLVSAISRLNKSCHCEEERRSNLVANALPLSIRRDCHAIARNDIMVYKYHHVGIASLSLAKTYWFLPRAIFSHCWGYLPHLLKFAISNSLL
jgi:hypothetical protein